MRTNWAAVFAFSLNPWEIVLRGTLVYWFLFLLFRFGLRRDVGTLGIADVLLLVVVADASQNAMAGSYESVSEGFVLVGTIAAWNFLLDWLGYRFPRLRRIIEPERVTLMRHGRVLLRNLRGQLMTMEDLRSKLREHGIERFGDVKLACMEPDGEVSVIRAEKPGSHDDAGDDGPSDRRMPP